MRPIPYTAVFVFIIVSLVLSGCPNPDQEKQYKTNEGLQERNKALSAESTELKDQVKTLKAEIAATKEGLDKEHANALAQLRQLYEEKQKKLEGDKADLLMALSKETKAKLALEELDDARRLLPGAEYTRFGIERLIWILMLAAALAVLAIVAGKYHRLRGQLHQLVLYKASQLHEIKVAP